MNVDEDHDRDIEFWINLPYVWVPHSDYRECRRNYLVPNSTEVRLKELCRKGWDVFIECKNFLRNYLFVGTPQYILKNFRGKEIRKFGKNIGGVDGLMEIFRVVDREYGVTEPMEIHLKAGKMSYPVPVFVDHYNDVMDEFLSTFGCNNKEKVIATISDVVKMVLKVDVDDIEEAEGAYGDLFDHVNSLTFDNLEFALILYNKLLLANQKEKQDYLFFSKKGKHHPLNVLHLSPDEVFVLIDNIYGRDFSLLYKRSEDEGYGSYYEYLQEEEPETLRRLSKVYKVAY